MYASNKFRNKAAVFGHRNLDLSLFCRLAAYAAKKAKKPQIIAKSNIILDVKPWDDETDMDALEKSVRSIQMDGLLWGACKCLPPRFLNPWPCLDSNKYAMLLFCSQARGCWLRYSQAADLVCCRG